MKTVRSKAGKLQLAKETLRSLSGSELGDVRGGSSGIACVAINPGTDAAATCNVGSSVRDSLVSRENARCMPSLLTFGDWNPAASHYAP